MDDVVLLNYKTWSLPYELLTSWSLLLFCDVTHRVLVVVYRSFGTSYLSHLLG